MNDREIEIAVLNKWAKRGVFPKLHDDKDTECPNDDEKKKHPDLEPRQVVTQVRDEGIFKQIHVNDYAMKWKSFCKPGVPSTTHELTFDMKNGFDPDFVYVSGVTVNMIARVSRKDPTRQQLFKFPTLQGADAEPHTLIFSNVESEKYKGKLWVGLEEQGLIVKLDMPTILDHYGNMHPVEGEIPDVIKLDASSDYETVYDVRIQGDAFPRPINTRPHGFCFDAKCEYIWFTGKLTNTVGRIKVDGSCKEEIHKTLQHFELPTLGSVPIYVALGPDNNIWGTCLTSSMIFRATTGANPVIDEMTISALANNRRPIAIKPDPRITRGGKPMQFMWFSTEAGHSVCRLDVVQFEKEVKAVREQSTRTCQCSTACAILYRGSKFNFPIITEFPVPKINHKMLVGGVAIDKEGALYVQSYVNPSENDEGLPDYVIKLNIHKHYPTSTHKKGTDCIVNMTGVPVDYYVLPTKNTILHRISVGPDDSIWFTELGADRLGTIKVVENTKRKANDDITDGAKKAKN